MTMALDNLTKIRRVAANLSEFRVSKPSDIRFVTLYRACVSRRIFHRRMYGSQVVSSAAAEVSCGLQIVGAGWGRTGTDSLRQALNKLGFGPTMHMYEIMEAHPFKLIWRWLKVGAAPTSTQRKRLLREAMRGYKSAIDGPSFVYYVELLELYPEAKVILTVRASAREWYDSAIQTIFLHTARPWNEITLDSMGLHLYQQLHPIGWLFQEMLRETMSEISPHPTNRTDTELRYDAWIQQVIKDVPADKLLIMNPGDGWEPLCRFLNVSIPTEPYPRLNSREYFQEVLAHESRLGWLTLLVYLFMALWIMKSGRLMFVRDSCT